MSQKEKHTNEEDALEGALYPIVNRLIDKNFENSGDKIASQIAPLIGGAIREQIKHQKDDIVDALYPVMGNMITKFVTKSLEELLNKINDQIQNGLSATAIKRKIKAKIKGVSETELLLQESSEAKIIAVLLIHKESGMLLAKVEDEKEPLSDTDMLASMMTAIRSFVNEWVNNNNKHQELGEIEYGGNKIIIEASGYSYLAVIVKGAAYHETYEKIRETLEKIVLQEGNAIKEFQGNFETFPKEAVKQELQQLLLPEEEKEESKKKKSPLLFFIPLLLLGYIGYLFYNNYIDEEIQEKIVTTIEHTPQLSPFKIDVDVTDKIVTLHGRVPFTYHKQLLQKELEKIKGVQSIHNDVKITPTLTDPMQVSANIAYLLKGVNLANQTNINYTFDYNTLTLTGSVTDMQTKEKLLKALKEIKGITNIKDTIKIDEPVIPAIYESLYFDTASTRLNKDTLKKLKEFIQSIKKRKNALIELQAYSDMIGNMKTNRELARKRIESIKKYLLQDAKLKNKIETMIFNTPPPGIDAKKEPKKARVIILKVKKETTSV